MRRTVTIYLPDGYESPSEFAKDCGFELQDGMCDLVKAAKSLVACLPKCGSPLPWPLIDELVRLEDVLSRCDQPLSSDER